MRCTWNMSTHRLDGVLGFSIHAVEDLCEFSYFLMVQRWTSYTLLYQTIGVVSLNKCIVTCLICFLIKFFTPKPMHSEHVITLQNYVRLCGVLGTRQCIISIVRTDVVYAPIYIDSFLKLVNCCIMKLKRIVSTVLLHPKMCRSWYTL